MAAWDGKSKGNTLGYRIFIFVLRAFGLGATYFLLRFVSFYYFLFSVKSNRAIHFYFSKVLNYSYFKSVVSRYKSYYLFGQTLVDRVAIISGGASQFTYEFENESYIQEMVEGGKGGILLSAHIGNWEIAGYLFKRLKTIINIIVYEGENKEIKKVLDDQKGDSGMKFIVMQDNLNHIYEISAALQRGELVCLHADRFMPWSKVVKTRFLGREALFPHGPFALAAGFKVPVLFVFAMKEGSRHYHLSSTKPTTDVSSSNRTEAVTALLQEFATKTESMVKRYPHQWYNFYPFWNTRLSTNLAL